MNIPDMPFPLCLIENGERGFKINEEAVRVISQITSPVTVVAIVGPYRTGKSYLLNRLMGRNDGFALGSAIRSKTKGIWIWCRPHPLKRDQMLILLDTEGLGDVEKGSNTNDNHIFALATLLSSTLVYNNIGTLHNDVIDKIHFVSEMTELIKVRSSTEEEDGSEFSRFFPDFIWTVRDFTLELNLDGRDISADEYLEQSLKLKPGLTKRVMEYNLPRQSIRHFFKSRKCFVFNRPVKDKYLFKDMANLQDNQLEGEFLRVAARFCAYVFNNSTMKTYEGKALNGRSLCGLARIYVETLNSGKVPCLQNAYAALAQIENVKAVDEAVEAYSGILQSIKLPAESLDELSVQHQKFLKQAVEAFMKKCFNDVENQFQQLLMEETEKKYNQILRNNSLASQTFCQNLLQRLGEDLDKKLANGAYIKPGGFNVYSKDKAQVVQQYSSTSGKGVQAEDVLRIYLQGKETEGRYILAGDEEMTEKEKELSAQQQATEQAEQRERAAIEEQEKAEQRLRDEKASHDQHLRQLVTKMKEEQRQQRDEYDALLTKKLEEQKKMLNEGFKVQADGLKQEIDSLKKKAKDNYKQLSVFKGFLKGVLQEYTAGSMMPSTTPTLTKNSDVHINITENKKQDNGKDEAQQEATEQAEQRERAAREEQEKAAQRLRDEKTSHDQHLRQLETKMKEVIEQQQQRDEYDAILSQRLEDQKKMLNEGFKVEGNGLKQEIDRLKKKADEDNYKQLSEFIAILKGVVIQAYTAGSMLPSTTPTLTKSNLGGLPGSGLTPKPTLKK